MKLEGAIYGVLFVFLSGMLLGLTLFALSNPIDRAGSFIIPMSFGSVSFTALLIGIYSFKN